MSLKRTATKPTAKRTTTPKKKPEPAPKETPNLIRNQVVPPAPQQNVLVLPAPALLSERKEADELIKKLTDTLPAILKDEVQMGQASEHLIITRKLRKMFEDTLKDLKKPINKALDDLKNDYNPYIVRLEETEKKLNGLLSAYRAEATRLQNLEDQRIQQEHDKAMQDARDQGVNPLSLPQPVRAVAPPTGFQTSHGKTTTMRIAKWRVVDESQIPYQFGTTRLWLLNEAGIGQLRRAAGVEAKSEIPGIEFFTEETTVVK